MNMKNKMTPFLEAIDFSDYRKLANITCTTDPDTNDQSKSTDPSFITDTGICRGFKKMNLTDCFAPAEANTRRLCKCVDKGTNVNWFSVLVLVTLRFIYFQTLFHLSLTYAHEYMFAGNASYMLPP